MALKDEDKFHEELREKTVTLQAELCWTDVRNRIQANASMAAEIALLDNRIETLRGIYRRLDDLPGEGACLVYRAKTVGGEAERALLEKARTLIADVLGQVETRLSELSAG